MKAKEFYFALLDSVKDRKDIVIKKYKLKYSKGEYGFLRIASRRIKPKDRVIFIRAGIHGDEVAGPLTILSFCNKIIDCVHQAGLKCIIYPLGNPWGFETQTRYSPDWKLGDLCNNDFLRYELENGSTVETISRGGKFKKWHWASDKKLKIKLPPETVLMHKLLKKDPLSQIAAFLDLHQDFKNKDGKIAAYHYSFGDLSVYKNIVESIKEIVPIFRSTMCINKQGFITEHDGSLDDLMHRLGVKYCVTCETTGATPIGIARKVNLIWIFGIVNLVKEGKDNG